MSKRLGGKDTRTDNIKRVASRPMRIFQIKKKKKFFNLDCFQVDSFVDQRQMKLDVPQNALEINMNIVINIFTYITNVV